MDPAPSDLGADGGSPEAPSPAGVLDFASPCGAPWASPPLGGSGAFAAPSSVGALAGAGGTGAAGAEAGTEPDPPLGAAATSVGAEAGAAGAAAGAGAEATLGALGAEGAEGVEAPKLELDPLEADDPEPPPKVGREITPPPEPEKAAVGAGTGAEGAEKAGAGGAGAAAEPLKSCRDLSGRRGATGAGGKFGEVVSKAASREAPTTGLSDPGFFASRGLVGVAGAEGLSGAAATEGAVPRLRSAGAADEITLRVAICRDWALRKAQALRPSGALFDPEPQAPSPRPTKAQAIDINRDFTQKPRIGEPHPPFGPQPTYIISKRALKIASLLNFPQIIPGPWDLDFSRLSLPIQASTALSRASREGSSSISWLTSGSSTKWVARRWQKISGSSRRLIAEW